MKILTVLGARPQFIKAATVSRVIKEFNAAGRSLIQEVIVHTGQHYDKNMSDIFFEEMEIPKPDYNLGIGGKTHGAMTGQMLEKLESLFIEERPDVVLVYGDTNSTLAGALAASKLHIPVAHVEGGEVSGSIDESIRHAITKLSHIHFPASEEAAERIIKMGESESSVHCVGGTSMDAISGIDTENLSLIYDYQLKFGNGPILDVTPSKYLVVIQHPVTTEYEDNYYNITQTINAIQELNLPTFWILPNMDGGADGINKAIRQYREQSKPTNVHFFKSLPIEVYAPLLKNAGCLIGNSSSGIRESAFLGTPSVNIGTRQHGRERGPNVIDVDYNTVSIVKSVLSQLSHGRYQQSMIYGDGLASKRIVDVLTDSDICLQKTITY